MRPATIDGQMLPPAQGDANAAPAPGMTLEIGRSLRMHRVLATVTFLAVFAAVLGFALTRQKSYAAEALIYEDPSPARLLGDGVPNSYDAQRYDSFLQQQIQTATRPDILRAALAKLPEHTWQGVGESDASATTRLASALKVQRVGESYQLSIGMKGPDPEKLAAIVNAVTQAYLEQGKKDELAQADVRLQLLTEEKQRIEAELTQYRQEQAELGTTLGVASPVGPTGNPFDSQLTELRTQLASAREAHEVAAAQLAAISTTTPVGESGLSAAADEMIATDPGLGSMKASISARRATLSSQMASLTPNNPVYKQDQQELALLDREENSASSGLHAKAARRLEDKLRLDLSRTANVEARLSEELRHQTAQATGAAPKLQRASEITTAIDRLETRYATVDDSIRGLQLQTGGPGLAHLSVPAVVPSSPEASKKKLIAAASLPLALAAGLGAAIFAKKRDRRVYVGSDVERALGFPPIGLLPAMDEVSSLVTDEYLLRLAAGLESAYRSGSARTFVFTAASASIDLTRFIEQVQGKLTELGFRAGLVDTPSLTQQLGTSSQQMQKTAPETELVSGRPAALESFAGARLERLKQSYDVLLLDAAPLLYSAETEYAVRVTDATVLVAESGVTTRDELQRSRVLLQRLGARGLGAVLREVHRSAGDPDLRVEADGAVRRSQRAELRPHYAVVDQPLETNAPEPPVELAAPAASVPEPRAKQQVVEPAPAPVEIVADIPQEAPLVAEPVAPAEEIMAVQGEAPAAPPAAVVVETPIDEADDSTKVYMVEDKGGRPVISALPRPGSLRMRAETPPETTAPIRSGFPGRRAQDVLNAMHRTIDGVPAAREAAAPAPVAAVTPPARAAQMPDPDGEIFPAWVSNTATSIPVTSAPLPAPPAPATLPQVPVAAEENAAAGRRWYLLSRFDPRVQENAGDPAAEAKPDNGLDTRQEPHTLDRAANDGR